MWKTSTAGVRRRLIKASNSQRLICNVLCPCPGRCALSVVSQGQLGGATYLNVALYEVCIHALWTARVPPRVPGQLQLIAAVLERLPEHQGLVRLQIPWLC